MTKEEFIYNANFPNLEDADINTAYEYVSAMFSGVLTLWSVLPATLRDSKRNLCINLLVAWYLMDTQPEEATGVIGNGGMSLNSKGVGGTSVSFTDLNIQEGLKQLNSNMFGQKALIMIQGAPERFGLYA